MVSEVERALSVADASMTELLECVERLVKLTAEYTRKVEAVDRAVSAVASKVGSMEEAKIAHANLVERLAARGNVVAPPQQFPRLESHIDVQTHYVDRILGSEKEEVLAFLRQKVQISSGGALPVQLARSPSANAMAAHLEVVESTRAATAVAEHASDGLPKAVHARLGPPAGVAMASEDGDGEKPRPATKAGAAVADRAPVASVEAAGASKHKSVEAAAEAESGASKRKGVEAAAEAESGASKRKSVEAAAEAESGASKRKSVETAAEAEPAAKIAKRASTAGGESEAEPSKALSRTESKSEARMAAKNKALADQKAALEIEEALQRRGKGGDTPTRQMLNSDEYFRHHVARELAEQYLHEKGAPKSLKVAYPFLTELDMPEGNHRHRGSIGLAGALAVVARYIGTIVDLIIMREADSPRSEFDKIFPFYGANWALAQNKFPSNKKDLFPTSMAYQELCRETARMSPQIHGFLIMSIDKFRVHNAFAGAGSTVLGLTTEQRKALGEFSRFKQVIEYLLDKDNYKGDGDGGEDGVKSSPATPVAASGTA
jgi:hypothetical protein